MPHEPHTSRFGLSPGVVPERQADAFLAAEARFAHVRRFRRYAEERQVVFAPDGDRKRVLKRAVRHPDERLLGDALGVIPTLQSPDARRAVERTAVLHALDLANRDGHLWTTRLDRLVPACLFTIQGSSLEDTLRSRLDELATWIARASTGDIACILDAYQAPDILLMIGEHAPDLSDATIARLLARPSGPLGLARRAFRGPADESLDQRLFPAVLRAALEPGAWDRPHCSLLHPRAEHPAAVVEAILSGGRSLPGDVARQFTDAAVQVPPAERFSIPASQSLECLAEILLHLHPHFSPHQIRKLLTRAPAIARPRSLRSIAERDDLEFDVLALLGAASWSQDDTLLAILARPEPPDAHLIDAMLQEATPSVFHSLAHVDDPTRAALVHARMVAQLPASFPPEGPEPRSPAARTWGILIAHPGLAVERLHDLYDRATRWTEGIVALLRHPHASPSLARRALQDSGDVRIRRAAVDVPVFRSDPQVWEHLLRSSDRHVLYTLGLHGGPEQARRTFLDFANRFPDLALRFAVESDLAKTVRLEKKDLADLLIHTNGDLFEFVLFNLVPRARMHSRTTGASAAIG